MTGKLTAEHLNEIPVMEVAQGTIVLFHPYIPEQAIQNVAKTLRTRWIGQGPQVEAFEKQFGERFTEGNPALAVGSGTDALHLSYILAGLKPGDEVIAPAFTCTATNIPLLYMGVKVRFADVQRDTLNIDTDHVKALVNDRTRAIVCVDYGGLPCDLAELGAIGASHGIPVIEDAAHALGATYRGKSIGAVADFTMYSFQAIKHITTGDGGLLTFKNRELTEVCKRIRWFGIDRSAKQKGHWENDIREVGYKYQMTDIAASMGLAGLADFPHILDYRKKLLARYASRLEGVPGISLIGLNHTDREHAAWLCTVLVERRRDLQEKLYEHKIESNQVHYRNDRYSIFGQRRTDLPNMDALEEKYLVLPLHMMVRPEDVDRICDVIRSGW
jgi:perosamine synthetase